MSTVQAMASKTCASSLTGPISCCISTPGKTRLDRQWKPIVLVALALTFLLSSSAWAKGVQLAGVHYQPEGLVIQVADGKIAAPGIETWPNIRDGVKTELIMIRMPGCTGDYNSLQQAGSQEVNGHPEVKQFWIAPFSTDPKAEQGTQVVLEVETRPDAPEFTPEVLSQGNAQWVITLQGKTIRPNGPWRMEASNPIGEDEGSLLPITPEPVAYGDVKSVQNSQGKATGRANDSAALSGQNLLVALNQSKQRQAELGLQLIASQQALTESLAQEERLQNRLNGYENILETAGADPKKDEHSEATAVIQNLRSALVKVAQKLKAAEDTLAIRHNTASATKTGPTMPNKSGESIPPMATLGLVEDPVHPSSQRQLMAQAAIPNPKPLASRKPAGESSVKAPVPIALSAAPDSNVSSKKMALPTTPAKTQTKSGSNDLLATLKLTLQKTPYNADSYLNLADFYVASKDWTNAKNTLILLTQVKPDHAPGYYYLSLIYLQETDKKNAQTMLTQYAKYNPSDTQGIRKLKKALQGNSATLTQASPPKSATIAPQKRLAQQ